MDGIGSVGESKEEEEARDRACSRGAATEEERVKRDGRAVERGGGGDGDIDAGVDSVKDKDKVDDDDDDETIRGAAFFFSSRTDIVDTEDDDDEICAVHGSCIACDEDDEEEDLFIESL